MLDFHFPQAAECISIHKKVENKAVLWTVITTRWQNTYDLLLPLRVIVSFFLYLGIRVIPESTALLSVYLQPRAYNWIWLHVWNVLLLITSAAMLRIITTTFWTPIWNKDEFSITNRFQNDNKAEISGLSLIFRGNICIYHILQINAPCYIVKLITITLRIIKSSGCNLAVCGDIYRILSH